MLPVDVRLRMRLLVEALEALECRVHVPSQDRLVNRHLRPYAGHGFRIPDLLGKLGVGGGSLPAELHPATDGAGAYPSLTGRVDELGSLRDVVEDLDLSLRRELTRWHYSNCVSFLLPRQLSEKVVKVLDPQVKVA